MLLKNCVCGERIGEVKSIFSVPVISCNLCGVVRQIVPLSSEEYSHVYRNGYIEKRKRSGHSYEHDYDVAALRYKEYREFMSEDKGYSILDVGSSNGAFVDLLRNKRYEAFGVDTSGERVDNYFYYSSFERFDEDFPSFDLITFHDVLEHLVNPLTAIKKASSLLSDKGYLIIDLPDFWIDKGKHHWKKTEHLWMFSQKQLIDLVLKNTNFTDVLIRKPIPSKLVFYFNS